MKTLTTIDFLSTYKDIVLDGICVPDYLRPKGNQTFTRVDVVRTYNKLTWLDYIEMPKEANKESFLKFITLIGIIRSREGEEEARIEARTIFSENIALCNLHWKEVECEVVSKEE